jgi:hypothetical protein
MTRRGPKCVHVLLLLILLWSATSGSAWALDLGQRAPDFVLPGTPDAPLRLSQYFGTRVVVLHFYLGDFLNA